MLSFLQRPSMICFGSTAKNSVSTPATLLAPARTPSAVISPAAPATPIKSALFTPGGVRIDLGDPALVEIEFIV